MGAGVMSGAQESWLREWRAKLEDLERDALVLGFSANAIRFALHACQQIVAAYPNMTADDAIKAVRRGMVDWASRGRETP